MGNKLTTCIAALAFATMVGVPLAISAPQDSKAQASQASQTATGELVRVDVNAKTLAIRTSDNHEMQFSFDNDTKITGATSSPAGLATMEGSEAMVHYMTKSGARTATEVQISPKKK